MYLFHFLLSFTTYCRANISWLRWSGGSKSLNWLNWKINAFYNYIPTPYSQNNLFSWNPIVSAKCKNLYFFIAFILLEWSNKLMFHAVWVTPVHSIPGWAYGVYCDFNLTWQKENKRVNPRNSSIPPRT